MSDADAVELERLEADRLAIEKRWSAPSAFARVTVAVRESETRFHAELSERIEVLRRRLNSRIVVPTPAVGTLSSPHVGRWESLTLAEVPEQGQEFAAPMPISAPAPRDRTELEREVHELIVQRVKTDFMSMFKRLDVLLKDWSDDPRAVRLIGAAFFSMGAFTRAEKLRPTYTPVEMPAIPCDSPFLVGATEPPDDVTGLTATELRVLRVVNAFAGANGPLMRLSEVLVECQVHEPEIDVAVVRRALISMGHPSLRPLPLVELRMPDLWSLEVSHVRATPLASEVVEKRLSVPLLLINGAAGSGACFPPFGIVNSLKACVRILDARLALANDAAGFFLDTTLPSGARFEPAALGQALRFSSRVVVRVTPRIELEVEPTTRRARILATRIPWPVTGPQLLERIEHVRHLLDGVSAVVDLSGSNATRVAFELEHVAFARLVMRNITSLGLLTMRMPVELTARDATTGSFGSAAVLEYVRTFLFYRREAVTREKDQAVVRARLAAEQCEAVCVATLMLERVLEVIRSADDDASAEDALMKCMRDEDRAVLTKLAEASSHDYREGFTRAQAEHLVRQRKLKARSFEHAQIDWLRARDAVEEAKRSISSVDDVFACIAEGLAAARRRYS